MKWHTYSKLQLARNNFSKNLWELTADESTELERQFQRRLTLETKVLAHPLALKIAVKDEDISIARSNLDHQFGSEEIVRNLLLQADLTETHLEQALQHEIQVQKVFELVVADVQPMSEIAARSYYMDHPQQFQRPERRDVRHILITIDESSADNCEVVVKARLEQIRMELLSNPEHFPDLALRYSECPTALEKGHIGYVTAGQLYPELDKHLFQMRSGEVSPVLSSPMGLHLLQCVDISPAQLIPIEEAVPKIIQQQYLHACTLQQKRWLKELQQSEQYQLSS
jgi:peptidyl-prolyl cis-trans isomerase C